MKRPHLISKNGYLHIAFHIHKFGPGNKPLLDQKGKPKWFRKTISTGHADNKQGRSLAGDVLQQYRSGSLRESNSFSPILLSDFLHKYNLLYPTKNPDSLKVYKYAVTSFTRSLGDRYMHLYTVEEIDMYISSSIQRISPITVKNYIRHLTTLFSRSKKYQHIQANMFDESISIDLPEPVYKAFTIKEFTQFMKVVDNEKHRDIYLSYVYTGMRLSELLRQELFEIDDKFIHVSKTKTKNDRFIEIHSKLKPIIEKYRKLNKTYLFEHFSGKQIHIRSIQEAIREYLIKAKLDPKLTVKAMRKTYGSWLLDKGIPIEYISAQLGHTNVVITQKHYSKYKKKDYKGWVNQMA